MKTAHRAAIAFDGFERAEADGPPTAFRIWRAGDNETDHCPTVFTERSAQLLLEQQERRGNRFSVDVNHLSLDPSAPLENQRAVGWFDIEVRNGELWAINVEWTDTVRDGLTKSPPEWRYHSPAYDVDKATGEVLSLTNLALTNNPATWSVTALATCGAPNRETPRMKFEDVKAAFDGADDDKKAAAWKAIAAAMASGGTKAEGEEPEKKEGEEPEAKKDAEDEPEKKDSKKAAADEPAKKDAAEEPEKKDTKASAHATVLASQDARIRELEARIAKADKENEAKERKSLIASRVMSKELAKTLAEKPLSFVRDVCAALPAKVEGSSSEHVQATMGENAGQGSALPADEKAKLDERMGIRSVQASIRNDRNKTIFPTLTPEEARSVLAAKAAKGVK